MSSVAKSSLAITTAPIATNLVGNPGGVRTPLNELLAYIILGYLSISADDTHLKHLEDALQAGTGISLTVQNEGGNETLLISINGTTAALDVTGTAGENLAIRDQVYLNPSDNKWYKIDSDATATVDIGTIRGFATAAISADATGAIRLKGYLSGFTGLTAGLKVYSSTTAGGYTQTKPTVATDGAQLCLSEMGLAVSTTTIFIDPKPLVYLKKASLDDDENLTIEHHADADSYQREVIVLIDATYHSQAQVTEWGSDEGFECRFDDGSGSDPTIKTTIKNSTGGTLTVEMQVRF